MWPKITKYLKKKKKKKLKRTKLMKKICGNDSQS